MSLHSTKKPKLFFELKKITGNQKLNIFVLVLVFFALIFIFVNTPNLSITKVISQIISQANRIITSQSSVKKDYLVIDSFGRAKVMSPRGSNPIKTVAELNGKLYGIELENKAGLNNAIPLESGAVKTVDEFMQSKQIKISYILGMTIEPNVSGAVNFVKASVDAGMMPIIRLCYDGGCSFNLSSSADQIIDFYSAVAQQLDGTDYEFIAVLGPNEPGTGSEAIGFGVPPVQSGGYNILIQRANEAAEALQEYRFENGGPMYLAPAIFNVTNTQNDDVNAYLFGQFGQTIDPTLFDYLLGNSYNLSNGDADYFYTEAIGSRPQSMKAYAEANNLPVIFTEIGFFTGDYLRLKDTYQRMCSDSTIEGLLFFRPLPVNTLPGDVAIPRQDPPITPDQLKEIINSCKEAPDRLSGRKRWFNANFDACVPIDYNNNNVSNNIRFVSPNKDYALGSSTLYSCGREFESKDNSILIDRKKGPQFLLKCSGSNCSISWKGYIMIETPIRSLASTNAVNSAYRKSFTPASVLIASYYTGSNFKNKDFYDPLNQFAHGLKSENFVYPVPWLGSYINNTTELIKATDQFAKVLNNQNFYPSSFSIVNLAKKETEREINFNPKLVQNIFNTSYQPLYSITQGNIRYIPDERALCLVSKNGDLRNFTDAKCLDNREFDLVKAIEKYDFTKTSQNWKEVEAGSCTEQKVKFLNSSDEYLPGPEVNVSAGNLSFSNSEVCWRFGNRKIHQDTKDYWSFKYDRVGQRQKQNFDFGRNGSPPSCTVKTGATVARSYDCSTAISLINSGRASTQNLPEIQTLCNRPVYQRPSQVTIQEFCTSIINQTADTGQNQNIRCQTKDGNCNFPRDTKDICFSYVYSALHQTYIRNNPFPEFQEYSIPKLNDSLYHMYLFLNSLLSTKNLKFVFGDANYGWRVKVHSILRDENKKEDSDYISSEVTNYPYLFNGESSNENCVNDTSKFFDNKSPKARGRSDIIEYQYFPWAGALDVLQEILMTYALNTTLPEVSLAKNTDGTLKLKNGKPFLQSYRKQDGSLGPSANLASSRPFLTCDEVIACKEEKNNTQSEWCPIKDQESLQKIQEEFAYPCIDIRDKYGLSVNNYPDKLSDYLCSQGYIVPGKCDEIKLNCDPSSENSAMLDLNNINDTNISEVSCPIKSRHYCFQGPFGNYTHCNRNSSYGTLPLDLYSYITNNPNDRDVNIYSPEDGIVMSVTSGSYGTTVSILGKTGILYSIHHLDSKTVPRIGEQVVSGQKIGEYDKQAYSYNNWHIHVRAEYQGQQIDPYFLFGNILKCNAIAPDQNMNYLSPARPGMCRYGKTPKNDQAGISWGLNDNACRDRIDKEGIVVADNNRILELFNKTYNNRGSNKPTIKDDIVDNYCSSSLCKNLPPKNNVPYPRCINRNIGHCTDNWLAREFSNVDISGVDNCDQKINLIATNTELETINFLGLKFTVNKKIVNILKKIESEIQNKANSFNQDTYVFPSGTYTFVSFGGFNRVSGTSVNQCKISMHSFGLALDLNATTNPYTSSCSDRFDMPPEVVEVFEKNGFLWGGRFSRNADYMHFEYCPVSTSSVSNQNTNVTNFTPNLSCAPTDSQSSSSGTSRPSNVINRNMVLRLCSPSRVDWVNLSVDDVYEAFNKITKFDRDPQSAPNRTQRIRQILDAAKNANLNPAIPFAIWFTEGGFLGDGVAGDGTRNKSRNAYGFDFGCGIRCSFVGRDGPSKPTQQQYDEGFRKSLGCLLKTNNGCNLKCSFENITRNQTIQISGGPKQEEGLGGFLECYGPISDNNQYFARNFVKIYDAFFPPTSNHSHRRIQTQDCLMYLN